MLPPVRYRPCLVFFGIPECFRQRKVDHMSPRPKHARGLDGLRRQLLRLIKGDRDCLAKLMVTASNIANTYRQVDRRSYPP